jgi:hypothetical protein
VPRPRLGDDHQVAPIARLPLEAATGFALARLVARSRWMTEREQYLLHLDLATPPVLPEVSPVESVPFDLPHVHERIVVCS